MLSLVVATGVFILNYIPKEWRLSNRFAAFLPGEAGGSAWQSKKK